MTPHPTLIPNLNTTPNFTPSPPLNLTTNVQTNPLPPPNTSYVNLNVLPIFNMTTNPPRINSVVNLPHFQGK